MAQPRLFFRKIESANTLATGTLEFAPGRGVGGGLDMNALGPEEVLLLHYVCAAIGPTGGENGVQVAIRLRHTDDQASNFHTVANNYTPPAANLLMSAFFIPSSPFPLGWNWSIGAVLTKNAAVQNASRFLYVYGVIQPRGALLVQ